MTALNGAIPKCFFQAEMFKSENNAAEVISGFLPSKKGELVWKAVTGEGKNNDHIMSSEMLCT